MSTYTVDIYFGPLDSAPTHHYAVSSADPAPSEADPVVVLDRLTATWGLPDSEPFPSQPVGATANVRLLVDDVAELDDLNIGDAAYLKIKSGAATLWEWTAVLGKMTATIVRRKNARKVLVTIPLIDPLVQLDDVKIDLVRPAEKIAVRYQAIGDAVAAAIAANPRLAPALRYVSGGPALADNIWLAPLTANRASAYQLLVDVIRQYAGTEVQQLIAAHYYTDPTATLGSWFVHTSRAIDKGVQSPYPPGVLSLVAHKLGVAFDGASPAPASFAIPSGEVLESDISFVNSRYDAVRRVSVVPTDEAATVVDNGVPGGTELTLSTALQQHPAGVLPQPDPEYPRLLARAYLPDASDVKWRADGFTWYPSDAELATMDFPLNPVNIQSGSGLYFGQDKIMVAPVAITDLDPVVNPSSMTSWYGGTLSKAQLTIAGGRVIVQGTIAHRLQTSNYSTAYMVSWADIKANFPTVKTKTGTDVLDPTMTTYDLKLARKM